ncbi:MAG: hypothetical protein IBX52_00105 [Bacterioplanes sp.]|nr:hypothetical protein [Bacterioplanes sp.]
MITRPFLLLILCVTSIVFAPFSYSHNQQTKTALDVMSLFVQGASSDEVFNAAVSAQMRVEPKYLAIAYYNARTGEVIEQDAIRDMLGAFAYDGARQLLQIAFSLNPNFSDLSQQQVEQILDAAALASMHQLPVDIDIEFYDIRTGPTGRGGGGISGQVPTQAATSTNQAATQRSNQADENAFDPQDPHQREALISQVLPDSEEAMLDLMRNLGVRATPKEGLVAFFIIVAAPSLSQLEAAYEAEKMTHKQAFSLQHTETIDRFIERHDSGLYRLIEVAFFAGSDNDILEAVRTAVDGAFYADGSY